MADIDLNVLSRLRDAVLQFIGKHHLRQLALTIGGVGAVVLVPVHVVELDGAQAHLVAKARNHHDPARGLFDPVEQQPAEQEVAIVIGAQLAFMSRLGQLAAWHLRNGGVADQRVDPGNIAQKLCRSAAHRVQIGQIHPNKADLRRRAIFVFQLCHGLRRPLCTAVQHHDRGTFAQQGPRRLKTGPCIGPGDHKGLPLQPANPLRGPAVRAESLVCHGHAPYR